MATRESIFADINAERGYQDEKWGGPVHDDEHSVHDFVAFITKYAGNAVEASAFDQRKALIKVAALAVAAVEKIDRAAG